RVPTLVLHRTGDRCLRVDEGRYVASLIPGAKFVELPGDDHLPFVGDQDALLDAIEQFLAVARTRVEGDRALVTILCAELDAADRTSSAAPVSPAARLSKLRALVDTQAPRFGGTGVRQADDRIIVVFQRPARAIRCAREISVDAKRAGSAVKIGLHTG